MGFGYYDATYNFPQHLASARCFWYDGGMFWNTKKKETANTSEIDWVFVALGNDGLEYQNTRHNAGWIALDKILKERLLWQVNKYAQAVCAREIVDGKVVEYVKPMTMMNRSGASVQYAMEKHRVPLEKIVVIYDDIDLPFGKVKVSHDRGDGGHNGIKSIIQHAGGVGFTRIRIGISYDLGEGKVNKPNVLGKFSEEELKAFESIAQKVQLAMETIIKEGREKAMNKVN